MVYGGDIVGGDGDESPTPRGDQRGQPARGSRVRSRPTHTTQRGRARHGRRGVHGRRATQEQIQHQDVEAGWTQNKDPPIRHPFTATPGLNVPRPTTPLGFIQLFLSRALLSYFMRETNDYATFCRHEMGQTSAYKWLGVNLEDIAHYLGLRILMGIMKLPVEYMYWAVNEPFCVPTFVNCMPFQRFKSITKYFHFFNRRAVPKNNTDKLLHVRPLMENLLQKCRTYYTPEQQLALDEGMLAFKGHLQMRVYNPDKPDPYGIKLYILGEAKTGYVLDFQVYSGERNLNRDIVFNLMGQHLNKGYHLYMDNYYNSVDITEELYNHKTHTCGTLRLNRGAPKSLQNLAKRKVQKDELHFRKKNQTFIICWQSNRLVSVITNLHDVQTSEYIYRKRVRKEGRIQLQETLYNRPLAITDYNRHMHGVDKFDQMIQYYSFTRKSMKWTKKMVLYFIQMMIHNACVLYNLGQPKKDRLSLLKFHSIAAAALINFNNDDWPEDEREIPQQPSLPVEERQVYHFRGQGQRGVPPVHLPSTSAAADPQPSTSAAADPRPSTSASPPVATLAVIAEEEVDDPEPLQEPEARPQPEPPAATPVRRPRLLDPPYRLTQRHVHTPEKFTTHVRLKRCRVCYKSGKRCETTFQCSLCKVPLCVRQDCFERYHTLRQYWTSPPGDRGRRRGRGRGGQ